jgi:hypothetical protein
MRIGFFGAATFLTWQMMEQVGQLQNDRHRLAHELGVLAW